MYLGSPSSPLTWRAIIGTLTACQINYRRAREQAEARSKHAPSLNIVRGQMKPAFIDCMYCEHIVSVIIRFHRVDSVQGIQVLLPCIKRFLEI